MKQILNYFNRIEHYALFLWVIIIILYKYEFIAWDALLTVPSSVLSAAYFLQGAIANKLLKEKALILRIYPLVLGYASAMMTFGGAVSMMDFPGPGAKIMLRVAMLGLLASSLMLFYTPIQDEYMPVMKKVLLRLVVLIAMGFLFSF